MHQRWRVYPAILINENRWRAQRYGVAGEMVDHGKRAQVPVAELMEELTRLLSEDGAELGTSALLARAATIARSGTSADRQRAKFAESRKAGASDAEALIAVVDMLAEDFTSTEGVA